MEYDEVVLGRRSTRGFKPDPVPRELILEILTLATRAPSSMNTQPWNFFVVTGEPLDRIRAGNTERNLAGVPGLAGVSQHGPYEGAHRERQIEIAVQLFQAMGIERHDKEARQDWVLRGFRQFDAPVSVVVTYDKALQGGDIAPFDAGAVTNALVNAAWSRGLGCVVNSPGHHAVAGGAASTPASRRPGHPDLRRDGLPGRQLPGQRRGVSASAGRGRRHFVGFDDGE